jgi:tetratricopeptide (TPR) repeat protein
MEKYGKAKKLAKKLIVQRPGFHEIYLTILADILATHPDPKIRDSGTAIVIAKHGAELTEYQEPYNLSVLAAAYAGADRFELAIETAKKALELTTAQNQKKLADQIKFRLALYEQGKPYLAIHK